MLLSATIEYNYLFLYLELKADLDMLKSINKNIPNVSCISMATRYQHNNYTVYKFVILHLERCGHQGGTICKI